MASDSASCREKIYSADGDVSFGKVYNCTDVSQHMQLQRQSTECTAFIGDAAVCTSPSTVHVFLSMYTAVKAIKKSPQSKNNKVKICRKGKTLYVLGRVASPDTKEYFVFSEETYVFKRMWSDVKGLVVAAGHTVVEADVIRAGRSRTSGRCPRGAGGRPQRSVPSRSSSQATPCLLCGSHPMACSTWLALTLLYHPQPCLALDGQY